MVLIGHRGAGKTSLLRRMEAIYRLAGRRLRAIDLDTEIERQAGQSISSIFQNDGEGVFRCLETETFENIEKDISRTNDDVVIALGAGFPVATLKKIWRAIWIRRQSDESGRIFVDRPRLDIQMSQLGEFFARRDERTPAFEERADDVLLLDEGSDCQFTAQFAAQFVGTADPAETDYFQDQVSSIGGALTLLDVDINLDLKDWAKRRVAWGTRWFELRDDRLSAEQMNDAVRSLPKENILVSFRNPSRQGATTQLIDQSDLAFDWPIERSRDFSPRPSKPATYISLHAREASIEAALQKLEDGADEGASLKAALMVENFHELQVGHRWQNEHPRSRVFLPMSMDGRWSWYRLLRANEMSLNFFRESGGSSLDQPTLLQWIRRNKFHTSEFAAVLGDPVSHSRTPMEQASYFRARGLPVLAIRMSEKEWREGAVEHLVELGLRFAAVTAPLKRLAFEMVNEAMPISALDAVSSSLKSINTLCFEPHLQARHVRGANTDLEGLRSAFASEVGDIDSFQQIVVWGGGGTLGVMKLVFPKAQFVSVRTGLIRETNEVANAPEILIWAASLRDPSHILPVTWKPKIIFDLNYSEASPAREFAVQSGARYISGLAMFKAQAQAQRKFWDTCQETL